MELLLSIIINVDELIFLIDESYKKGKNKSIFDEKNNFYF